MPAAAEEATINKHVRVARPWNKTDIHYTLLISPRPHLSPEPLLSAEPGDVLVDPRCSKPLACRPPWMRVNAAALSARPPSPLTARRGRRGALRAHMHVHMQRPPHWRDPLPPAAGGRGP